MDQRLNDRHPTETDVLYSLGDVVLRDKLCNLSREGCMIHTDYSEVTQGESVEITLVDGVKAQGHVVWTRAEGFGVKFTKPIGEATLKYFQLPTFEEAECAPLTDRFGRVLPPLRSGRV